MIVIKPTRYPTKEVVVTCGECQQVIARVEWTTYADFERVKSSIRRKHKSCPFCGKKTTDGYMTEPQGENGGDSSASPQNDRVGGRNDKGSPKWVKRSATGDWEAKRKDGDFLVWKYGKGWRGRWREYGSDNPIMLGFAPTLESMKKRCENSVYWKEDE